MRKSSSGCHHRARSRWAIRVDRKWGPRFRGDGLPKGSTWPSGPQCSPDDRDAGRGQPRSLALKNATFTPLAARDLEPAPELRVWSFPYRVDEELGRLLGMEVSLLERMCSIDVPDGPAEVGFLRIQLSQEEAAGHGKTVRRPGSQPPEANLDGRLAAHPAPPRPIAFSQYD